MASPRYRTRVKAGVTVTAAAAVALGIGIGTADASARPWSSGGRPHPPKPAATASATATANATAKATATATATTTTTTTATTTRGATRGASPTPAATTAPTRTPEVPAAWAPPPANAAFDYQIGEPYTPPTGVTVVSRDHDAAAVRGSYNVCYVNAFQAQPDAASWWQANHPDLLLRDATGKPVVDPDWDEILLDYSTAAKRAALTTVVGVWIDQCATKGFQGLEPDNLDAYTRSHGLLTEDEAVAYAGSLAARAHAKGLAVGQKNTADLSTANARRAGFDFAVAEECADFGECQNYTATYGDHVLVIEYSRKQFTKACTGYGSTLSVVLRDVDVTAPGSDSYVFQTC